MEGDSPRYAPFIRDIGRGRDNATSLDYSRAFAMWSGVLEGAITDLELGAILIALRIKGESVEELHAFYEASQKYSLLMDVSRSGFPYAPVVIPSYNGARNLPNLTALLALLLARRGVPVLVHGKVGDRDVAPGIVPARVTTAEVFGAMGLCAAHDGAEVIGQLERGEPVFVPIESINPALARVMMLRKILGLRGSAHTLVKLLQPFANPALRLASYTHPEYQKLLDRFLVLPDQFRLGDVFLMRGTEGEVVANTRRLAQVDWYRDGHSSTVIEGHSGIVTEIPILPESRDAATTARWIQAVVSGELPVPGAITRQIDAIIAALEDMNVRNRSGTPKADSITA
ncbi:MAG: DNA-binding protein YbiB [Burkholderiaceae bacterium]|jgi:anthranilate phosphoribosyltransferase